MIYLITAQPGSGKSQYAIERFILDTIRENEKDIADWQANKSRQDKPPPLRRQVYTNIKGMMRPDRVAKIQAMVGGLPILPSPDDWRTCPDGSLVIYDEAQQRHLFPASGKPGMPLQAKVKATDPDVVDERITDFDTHRHRGFDIVLITQEQGLVHHWAKKFVNCHIDLDRPNGAEMMTVREWSKVQSNPDDYFARQAADTSTRRMDKATWDLYDSATVHTVKFRMPVGAKWAIRAMLVFGLVFAVAIGGFWLYQRGGTAEAAELEPANEEASGIAGAIGLGDFVQPAAVPVASPINGCAAGRHCRCWDFAGQLMPMDEGTCRNYAEGITAMPIDLNLFRGSGQGSVHEGGGGKGASPAPSRSTVAGVRSSPTSVGSSTQGAMQGRMPDTLRASGE